MITFDGIGGVDQSADVLAELEEGGQFCPVILPGAHSGGILVFSGFLQPDQIGFGLFPGGGLVDAFQISGESLLVFPGDILQ